MSKKIVFREGMKEAAVWRRAQRKADRTGKPVKIWMGGAVYGESFPKPKRNPPRTTIRGWVKAKAVKIVRNKRGQAVSVKIKT